MYVETINPWNSKEMLLQFYTHHWSQLDLELGVNTNVNCS